jgi:hypothetical protein
MHGDPECYKTNRSYKKPAILCILKRYEKYISHRANIYFLPGHAFGAPGALLFYLKNILSVTKKDIAPYFI